MAHEADLRPGNDPGFDANRRSPGTWLSDDEIGAFPRKHDWTQPIAARSQIPLRADSRWLAG
jgi:hypothetical protein